MAAGLEVRNGSAGEGIIGTSADSAGVRGESGADVGVVGHSSDREGSSGVVGLSDQGTGIEGHGRDTGVWGDSEWGNGAGVAGTNGESGTGVAGSADGGTGVDGQANGKLGIGVWGHSDTGTGVRGQSGSGVAVVAHSDSGIGVHADSGGNQPGVLGSSGPQPGVWGTSVKNAGVWGTAPSLGVGGQASGPGNKTIGVDGAATDGFGVHGKTFGTNAISAGVVGDSVNGLGVLAGTEKGDFAFSAVAHGFRQSGFQTLMQPPATGVAAAFGGAVTIDGMLVTMDPNNWVIVKGNFAVNGQKSAAVPHPDGSRRLLHSLECPESWFEDFGRGRLVRGRATVTLDRTFAAVVRGDYHIFLSPEGDCRGLYVHRRTRRGFEVREQQSGAASLPFSYRIVARRRDVTAPRFQKAPSPKAAAFKPLRPIPRMRPTASLPTPPAPPKHAFDHAGARRRRSTATSKARRRTAKRS